MNVRIVTNLTKEYPDMFKIVVYKSPKLFVHNDSVKRKREDVDDDFRPSISSVNRTKTLIRDIVLCNNFELFCTFTFDPKKVDSFSLPACRRVMSVWLHHQSDLAREKGKRFTYLIVPEQHKSGRWHFHALISGFSSTLKKSGCVSDTLRPIYNITAFRSGFTTAVYIEDKYAVSNYVTKYITKSFVEQFNQRRFFCSSGLIRPSKSVNSEVFSFSFPLFRRQVSESSETFEYIIDKSCYACNNGSNVRDVVQYRDHDYSRSVK